VDPVREYREGSLTGDFEGKINFRGWDVEGSVDRYIRRGPVGEPGEGSVYREL